MKKFEIEWEFYLQAYRLHQALNRDTNREARQLLQDGLSAASDNQRPLARGYGLLSFTNIIAWLNDWIDDDMSSGLAERARKDVQPHEKIIKGDALAGLAKLSDSSSIDETVKSTAVAHATLAVALDDSDWENHWSLAAANLYANDYPAAFASYENALRLAGSKVPSVNKDSISVDKADALFFAGNPDDNSDGAYIKAIKEAIRLSEAAIAAHPTDPKRNRWNWGLGWAHYELAGYTKETADYTRALEILQRIRNPHDLMVKNLIACHVGAGMKERAIELADHLKRRNGKYDPAVEKRWPYRNPSQHERWINNLTAAGLFENPKSGK
jgi:tetratricopeptide (TPR) repeat protein